MKVAIAFALAGALAMGAASAETFSVAGTGPDGPYKGTVVLTKLESKAGAQSYSVVWTIAGQTIEGVGLVSDENEHVLSIAYLYGGLPGVAIMTEATGQVTGVWWVEGLPNTGTEAWTQP